MKGPLYRRSPTRSLRSPPPRFSAVVSPPLWPPLTPHRMLRQPLLWPPPLPPFLRRPNLDVVGAVHMYDQCTSLYSSLLLHPSPSSTPTRPLLCIVHRLSSRLISHCAILSPSPTSRLCILPIHPRYTIRNSQLTNHRTTQYSISQFSASYLNFCTSHSTTSPISSPTSIGTLIDKRSVLPSANRFIIFVTYPRLPLLLHFPLLTSRLPGFGLP